MSAPPKPGLRRVGWRWLVTLAAAFSGAVFFILVAAMPYLLGDADKLREYAGRQDWLIVHISAGMVALLLGPFQLWLGASQPTNRWHRNLGMLYLAAIGVSSVAAYYLAFNTQVSFTFGFGLVGLATAWLVTCTMAMMAVKQRSFLQHQEWMIRSYVVTFAFVTFRAMTIIMEKLEISSVIERVNVASWASWALPLLICEVVLQLRKFRVSKAPIASLSK